MQKMGLSERPRTRSVRSSNAFAKQDQKSYPLISPNAGLMKASASKRPNHYYSQSVFDSQRRDITTAQTTRDSAKWWNSSALEERSQSQEALDEWNKVFNLQGERWQREFDDMKIWHPTEQEKEIVTKRSQQIKRMQASNFRVPDEFLPMQERSVIAGEEGQAERLRRDRIRARKVK